MWPAFGVVSRPAARLCRVRSACVASGYSTKRLPQVADFPCCNRNNKWRRRRPRARSARGRRGRGSKDAKSKVALIRVFIFTLTLAFLRRPGRAMRQLSASGKKTGRDARRTYALSVFCSVGVICRNRSGIIGFDLVARNARARSVFTPPAAPSGRRHLTSRALLYHVCVLGEAAS